MWMACATLDEIAEIVGVEKMTVGRAVEECNKTEELPKSYKVAAEFAESDFAPPLYNIWSFGQKTNKVNHFGNSEQRIVDNLLYLYTQPFDIVVDPFAGGTSQGRSTDNSHCRIRDCRYRIHHRQTIKAASQTQVASTPHCAARTATTARAVSKTHH